MISSVGQARAHCCTQCERSLGSSDDITKKGLLLAVPKRRGHAMPCRATPGSTRFGQDAEAEAGRAHSSQPLLCFLQGRQA